MRKKLVYLFTFCIILAFAIYFISGLASVGEVKNAVMTANLGSNGNLDMIYSYSIKVAKENNLGVKELVVPMINSSYSCSYYGGNIVSCYNEGKNFHVVLNRVYKPGEEFIVSFQVKYSGIYYLSGNEAIYKFKFGKPSGFNVKKATFRWNVNECIYSNETSNENGIKSWKLGDLGLFSKQIFVKFNNESNAFSKQNAKAFSITNILSEGGYLIVIFVIILIVNIIPNDSYKKNSGFGFKGSMRKFKTVKNLKTSKTDK